MPDDAVVVRGDAAEHHVRDAEQPQHADARRSGRAHASNLFDDQRRSGQCIRGSRLVVIPKASHPMSFDNPADFNREVLAFLRKP
jgi:pimeloyl-ACP methyl ester carboxylesterase